MKGRLHGHLPRNCTKILVLYSNNSRKQFYGSLDYKAKIIKPMRILGKRNMFIGERVHILNEARLEAISEYAGKKISPKLVIGTEQQ